MGQNKQGIQLVTSIQVPAPPLFTLKESKMDNMISQEVIFTAIIPGLEYSLELIYYGQGTGTGEEYPVLLTTCIWAFDVPEHPCSS